MSVDEYQRTTVADIFCAGEPSGIGGVDLSLAEGEIAGYAAAGKFQAAQAFFARRIMHRHFAAALERTFRLRSELRSLASRQTIVCRCEDVTREQLEALHPLRHGTMPGTCLRAGGQIPVRLAAGFG